MGPRDPFIRRNSGHSGSVYFWEGHEILEMSSPKINLKISLTRGAEILELRAKDVDLDLLWHGHEDIVRNRPAVASIGAPSGNFLDHFSGGWQEVLPSAQYPVEYNGASLGAHGEVALLSWNYRILTDIESEISVEFSVSLRRLPLRLIRVMTLRDAVLRFDERVENSGSETIDFQWGQHLALGGQLIDPGSEILVSDGEAISIPNYSGPTYRFEAGTTSVWPMAHLANGDLVNVAQLPADDGTDGHLVLGPMKKPSVTIRNRNLKIDVKMEWDNKTYPYCWIWMVWGGIKGWPLWGRDRLITVEPFSSPIISLDEAILQGLSLKIAPQGEVRSWVTFEILNSSDLPKQKRAQ